MTGASRATHRATKTAGTAGHGGLRHPGQRVTHQRLDTRQPGGDAAVVNDPQRVTNCCDLMDAAYCSGILRERSRSLGHVPLIDHNPRRGEKREFPPCEAQRYKARSQAERMNARLKDNYGGRYIWVKGHAKMMSHLMFGILALTADQLLRLLT